MSSSNNPLAKAFRWLADLLLAPRKLRRHEDELRALRGMLEELSEVRLAKAEKRQDHAEEQVARLDDRALRAEVRLDSLEEATRSIQEALEEAAARLLDAERRLDRSERLISSFSERLERTETSLSGQSAVLDELKGELLPRLERRMDSLEDGLRDTISSLEEIRDERLPTLASWVGGSTSRLFQLYQELLSLVQRILAGEPLPLPLSEDEEGRIAAALSRIDREALASLRGPSELLYMQFKLHADLVSSHQPVLDLGCGAGELIAVLKDAGIEVQGVEIDSAFVAECRRRGLPVVEADLLEFLGGCEAASFGSVCMIHVMEHLPLGYTMKALAQVRRVLRPGGLLLLQCPNPATLRVGAEEFWLDPTHLRPIPEKTARILLSSSGFEVVETRWLNPFDDLSPDQFPADAPGADVIKRLLDIVSGPRDWLLVARKPEEGDG